MSTDCGKTPCCDPCGTSEESLASQVSNLTSILLGTVTYTQNPDGSFVWHLPCDLSQGIVGFPLAPGEGLLCNFLRYYQEGVIGLQGPAGPQGVVGPTGRSALTETTSEIEQQPTPQSPLFSFDVLEPGWICPQMLIFIANVGWASVQGVSGSTVAASLVRAISSPSAPVPIGSRVVPTGPAGTSTVTQPTVATPTAVPVAGTYVGAQSIALFCETSNSAIYYTLDGSVPSTGSTFYNGPFSVSANTTVRAFAVRAGYLDSSVLTAAYVVKVAAPVSNVPGGSYGAPQLVTLTSATAGSTIRYTLDGSTPTEASGIVYSSPFSVSATATLRAIAYKSGNANSDLLVVAYTISGSFVTYHGSSATLVPSNAQIEAMTATTRASIAGSYDFGAEQVGTYQFFAFPAGSGDPAPAGSGSPGFYLPPFPLSMAGPAQGWNDGVVNGWYYKNINGRRVFRTEYPLGANFVATVNT